tara:strand:+ start:3090 stop:3608 length:519 start_codon:yes stop_codon:yes gene_type:complete
MPERITASEIIFREMSEEQAVKTFEEDGYFDYQKRAMRYGKYLPPDSIWANAPAKMFVAYYEDKPVGVIGFSKHKGKLLGAGIHVRKEFRGRGLSALFVDKIISEKGSKTLYVNIANDKIATIYRDRGFNDMNISELPKEIQEELQGINYPEQLQKWIKLDSPRWMEVLKWN